MKPSEMMQRPLPRLQKTISVLSPEKIKKERQILLLPLIDFLSRKKADNQTARLNFICTHNSRRSHFAQIWAQTMAYYFGFEKVACYSGGTEATALNSTVAKTLKQSGFEVVQMSEGRNPIYILKYQENAPAIIGFSKKYNDAFNPQSQFAAVMTCSQADESCPLINGAEKRFSLNYADPKEYDGTPEQDKKYKERSMQIANEMYYVFASAAEMQFI